MPAATFAAFAAATTAATSAESPPRRVAVEIREADVGGCEAGPGLDDGRVSTTVPVPGFAFEASSAAASTRGDEPTAITGAPTMTAADFEDGGGEAGTLAGASAFPSHDGRSDSAARSASESSSEGAPTSVRFPSSTMASHPSTGGLRTTTRAEAHMAEVSP